MLQFHQFSYSLGGNNVLENINFSLPAGAYLSIIGPNGAGKSTLLKCLLRLNDDGLTEGEIRLKGRELSSHKQMELARLLAYVPQAGGWIPPYTVNEFLLLSRYPYSSLSSAWKKSDLAAVERALALTGMNGFAGRLLAELSGGERQKAYLAAALAQGSEILLLDEPTSFLDPKHAAELSALLKRLNREEGLGMLTVSHDLNQVLEAGGSVLALRGGRQLFFGEAMSLMDGHILENTYRHRFSRFRHPESGRPVVMPEPWPEPEPDKKHAGERS